MSDLAAWAYIVVGFIAGYIIGHARGMGKI